jgi:hypothetical protein
METIKFRVEGKEELLMANPRTVDPFDPYTILKKQITAKRKKTDEDQLDLRRLDVESKIYWDDSIGVYVPATWVSAALAGNSWMRAKIRKAEVRSAVFPVDRRIKLNYEKSNCVKSIKDISGNPFFVKTMLLKQGQVKIAKCAPVFHEWSFETSLNFDKAIIDRSTLTELLAYAAMYGGFGDFRPTYGRAKFIEIED